MYRLHRLAFSRTSRTWNHTYEGFSGWLRSRSNAHSAFPPVFSGPTAGFFRTLSSSPRSGCAPGHPFTCRRTSRWLLGFGSWERSSTPIRFRLLRSNTRSTSAASCRKSRFGFVTTAGLPQRARPAPRWWPAEENSCFRTSAPASALSLPGLAVLSPAVGSPGGLTLHFLTTQGVAHFSPPSFVVLCLIPKGHGNRSLRIE